MRKPVLLPVLAVLAALLMLCAALGALSAQSQERTLVGLSAQESKWLLDNRDSIVLTYEANFPPLELRAKDGTYKGFSAEIVAKVEKKLGVTFQKVPSDDWNDQLASLRTGDTHLCAVIVRTPEREEFAHFTAPYISLPLVFITAASASPGNITWKDLAGKRVGVVSGYATETLARRHFGDSDKVVTVNSVREGLRDVSFGGLDAFVENLASVSYYIDKDSLTNLRVAGNADASYHLSIGVSRKYPLLYSSVQKALADIPSEEIEAARKRWISLSNEGIISHETWRLIKLVGVFCGLLLLGLGAISYYLKRRLNEKVATLRQAQQELLEQSERLSLASEATNAGMWELYPATERNYYSNQWYTMLGYEPGPNQGTHADWAALVHPDDLPATEQMLRDYIDSGGVGLTETEYRMRQADGTWRWVLGKARAVAWDSNGVPTRIVGLNLDIQKLKDVQEELRQKAALAKAAFDQTFQFSGLLDLNGNMLDVNKSALAFIEANLEDVLGQPFWDCPWWPDHEQAEAELRNDMATALRGGLVRREAINSDAHGNHATVDFSLSPLTGPDGTVTQFIAEGRDITESKRAETALKANEEKFRAIFQNSPVGIFRTTYEGQLLEANTALARMHGCASAQEYLDWARDLGKERYAHPEDRQRLLDALLKTPSGVSITTELRRKDGSTCLGIINAVLHMDEQGKPTFLDGTIEDISERQELGQRLADQLSFQQALLDTLPYAIFYKGPDTRFVGFNKAYEECFGVRREDLIGKRVLDLAYLPAEDRAAYQAEDEAVIASVGQVEREMPFVFADGQLHHTLYSVTGFRLTDGSPGGLIGVIVDITDLKQAEKALRESEERYRSVIQNMQDVYFRSDAQSRLIMVSPSGLELFGYESLDEVLGQLTESFYMIPSERQALWNKLTAEGVVKDHELLLKRKDGTGIQAATTASFYRDPEGRILGVEGIFRDITERKQAEERLRQSEEKFSRIFEMAPECISFVRMKDSMRIDANAAFETITGYPREEAIGRNATILTIWDDPSERDRFIAKLLAEGHVNDFEFLLKRKDGALRRVVSSAQLVNISGEECYVNVIHDITDERRMQELLIQSEKMMSVGSLAAGIAHEINNPLGIVHQAVQNLILRTSPEQKKNLETAAGLGLPMEKLQAYLKARKLDVFLEDIQAAALRASGIIRNMLNFSRRSESKRQTCDLHRIVEQSVFLASSDYDLKKSYDFKRIEINLDLASELPDCSCTETEIEQVLLNLLRNAAQAMSMAQPPTQAPRIDIRLRAVESGVRIEVADNGPGMDPDVQRKVFEPFFTTKPPGVGTGLGLSVSYFIVTKGHNGRMWVTSSPGRGTTFSIELPKDLPEAANG